MILGWDSPVTACWAWRSQDVSWCQDKVKPGMGISSCYIWSSGDHTIRPLAHSDEESPALLVLAILWGGEKKFTVDSGAAGTGKITHLVLGYSKPLGKTFLGSKNPISEEKETWSETSLIPLRVEAELWGFPAVLISQVLSVTSHHTCASITWLSRVSQSLDCKQAWSLSPVQWNKGCPGESWASAGVPCTVLGAHLSNTVTLVSFSSV